MCKGGRKIIRAREFIRIMKTKIDLHILEQYECLEPEAGEELLPLYPEFLTEEETVWFEEHLGGCELCREAVKLWQVTGLPMRVSALAKRAKTCLEDRHYEDAIRIYNHALQLEPNIATTESGQDFFQSGAWLSLTAAGIDEQDLMPYVAPSYAPEAYQLAAAAPSDPFPLEVEFADGRVKGTLTSAGRSVFFELLESREEFETGVTLVGKILQPVLLLKAWEIVGEKKCKLGTILELFGSAEFSEIVKTLGSFKVLPG